MAAAPIVLGITIRADGSSQVQGELNNIRTGLNNAGTAANQTNREFADMARSAQGLNSILGALGIGFGALGLAALAKDILATNRQFESLRSQLTGVMGDATQGARAYQEAMKWAIKTPFELADITKAFITLKTMGIDPTTATMASLTNMASRMGKGAQSLETITMQLGQAWSKGKLQMQDMNIMMEAGVPVLDALTKMTGKSSAEIMKMSENGELGRDTISRLIVEFGKLADGSSARAMDTLNGKISNLADSWHSFEDALLQDKSEGIIKKIVTSISDLLNLITRNMSDSLDAQIATLEAHIKTYSSMNLVAKGATNVIGFIGSFGQDSISADADKLAALQKEQLARDTANKLVDINKNAANAIKETNDWLAEISATDAEKSADAAKKAAKESASAAKSAASEAASAAKAAAKELEDYNKKVLSSLQGMAEARNEQLLINQGKALEAEISKNLSAMLGHQYDVREQLTQVQKDSVAAMTAETTETFKKTEAIRIQNAMLEESIRWHNELKDIQTATTDMQQLAVSAEALHNLGASNEEVKKRIDLEKTLNAEIKAHPDQDPQLITDSVIARQKASDTIAKYTDTNTSKSSEWMASAFKKAAESIQTSFASMFENMLNGDATASFAKFADNIRKTLNQAISQQLALDLQGLFSENGSIINVLKSGLLFAFASIGSLFKKTVAPAVPSPAMTYAGAPSTGIGAMAIADSFSRDRGYEYQSQTVMAFNKSLDNLSSSLMTAFKVGIEQFGTQLSSLSVVSTVSNFLKPLTSVVEGVYQSASKLVADGLASVGSALGLSASAFTEYVSASWSAGIAASTKTVAGAYQATEAAATKAGETGLSSAMKVGGQVLAVVGAIYSVVTYFTGLGDMIKRDNAVEIIGTSLGMVGAVITAAAALMVSGVGAIVGVVVLAIGAIVSLFAKQRTPNAWINNYNPDQSGAANDSGRLGNYSAQVGKSTYAGVYTEFGALVISTHEASLSIGAMEASFRPLLNTVAAVDHRLYDTIMRVDAAFGQTGQTMEFYNNQLRSYNGNEQGGYKAQQDLSNMNTGDLIMGVYTTIVAHLAESGTKVGLAIGAWFNVIVAKFIGASKDNSMFVLGVIDSLAANIESFMAFPLELVDLIGQSVKSTSNGGTPTEVMAEISGVLNAYTSVRSGLQLLGMGGDQGAVDSGIAKFLASINNIGYAVPDAANNLLAYGIALKLSGKSYGDALGFMAEANTKFAALKGQGLDNTAINAYFGSFGLMAKLFAEAKVSFSSADLDTTAAKLNTLAQASVTLANNVIDQAIATEKLTGVSRESAIATLVKSGKLQEATVAEALYGVSINTVTKDLLAQMGFVQQLGYLTGASLGSMNISASTWVAAAGNVVAVFGDLTKAMAWLDDVAKTFMSASDYANYGLTTIQRSMKNMVAANASLSSITAESITKLLSSGGNLSAFIGQLAEGSGSAAADTKNYVDLIKQEIAAKKAVADATGTATTSLSGLADSIDKINAIINKNQTPAQAQSATGSTLYAALNDFIPDSTLQTIAKSRSALADYVESLDKSSAAYPKIITALSSVDKGIESWYTSAEATAKAAADTAAATARTRHQLEIDLMTAQGDALGALAQTRRDELNAIDRALFGIKAQIMAETDLTAARKASADLAAQLLNARGDTNGATAVARKSTLDALDALLASSRKDLVDLIAANSVSNAHTISSPDNSGPNRYSDKDILDYATKNALTTTQQLVDAANAFGVSFERIGEAFGLTAKQTAKNLADAGYIVTTAAGKSDGIAAQAPAQDALSATIATIQRNIKTQQAIFDAQDATNARSVKTAYDRELLAAQGNTAGLAAFDKKINDAALMLSGWTQKQITTITTAQDATRKATERNGLQEQLNTLTDTSVQALNRQRDALNASNVAIFNQVQGFTKFNALNDRYKAPETAAQATAAVAAAGYNVDGLDSAGIAAYITELLGGAGMKNAAGELTTAGVAAVTAITNLASSFDVLGAATAKALELAKTNLGWTQQLSVLRGTQTQTEIDRFNALAAVSDEATKALMRLVYAQTDLNAANDKSLDDAKSTVTKIFAELQKPLVRKKTRSPPLMTLRLKRHRPQLII
jgi:tape measure domain-containing protein